MSVITNRKKNNRDQWAGSPSGVRRGVGEGSGQGCGEETVTRDWDVWSVISEVEQFRVMTGTGVWS